MRLKEAAYIIGSMGGRPRTKFTKPIQITFKGGSGLLNWILITGFWIDDFIWIDEATWND